MGAAGRTGKTFDAGGCGVDGSASSGTPGEPMRQLTCGGGTSACATPP